MLRRSLILLLAVALLGLAFTAGYALLPVRNPSDLLSDASAMIAQGNHLAAAELLDRSESSSAFAENQQLRRELWRLRLQAHRTLDVATRALQDIENLIQDGDDSLSLKMDRVYYLAKLGRGEEARQHGLEIAKANPKLARAQELAGEACKVAYTDALRAAANRVRADVGFEQEKHAVSTLLEFLYQPEGDSTVAAAKKRLRDHYLSETRLAQAWPKFEEELARLRGNVQEASKLFLGALECAGQDPKQRSSFFAAAFQGVAYSLEQGGRHDDLDAQAEIYFGSYTHRWRTDAAAAAAAARYSDGLYESAIAIAERCAPVETLAVDFAANRFTPAIRSLLITRCLSLYRLQRRDDLNRLSASIQAATKGAPAMNALPGLAWGLTHALNNNREHRTAALQWFCDVALREPAPQDGEDPMDLLMPLLIDCMAADGKQPAEMMAKLEAWATARPGNPLPLQTRAQWQIRLSQEAAAMATATAILQERPTDETALRLLAEAADLAYKASQQDGNSLVVHCLQRNMDRPDSPPHPVCYLLCAESALKQQHAWIAKACAKFAADRYPWSEWPTLLAARAEAMMGKPDVAIETLERLLVQKPDSKEAIRLCFELRVKEGEPSRQLTAKAVATMPGSMLALTELLRSAIEDDSTALLAIARKAASRQDADAQLLALASLATARRSDAATARALLARARKAQGSASPDSAQELHAAELACLVAESSNAGIDDLAAATEDFVKRSPCRGPDDAQQRIATARQLANRKHPKAASTLLESAMAAEDAIEVRDGATHAFAGDLAIQMGRVSAARESYAAAVSFEDGSPCAQRLARLELLGNAPQRAIAALASAPKTSDAALALLLGSQDASKIAKDRMAKSPDDLLALVTFSMQNTAKPDSLTSEIQAAPAPAQREALLACTLLEDPMLAPSAVEHAASAASQAPRCFLFALLHARAMLIAGDSQGAAATHARLYDEGRRAPLLWAEVSRSSHGGGYEPPVAILSELQSVAQKAPTSLRPETLAMLALHSAAEAERIGQPDVALGIRADVWRFYPTASRADADDAESLKAAGRTQAAVELLHALKTAASGAERDHLARALYGSAALARKELAPASAALMRKQAAEDLLAGCAPGEAFLFLVGDATAMANEPAERAVAMARAVIAANCLGKADWAVAEQAIRVLQDRNGVAGALSSVEEALNRHPSNAPLWLARATLRAELSESDLGLDDARAALACFDDAASAVDLVILAARLRATASTDRQMFEAIPVASRSDGVGKLAEGMLALRSGNSEQAEKAFAACADRTETLLYFRALANLMRTDPAARQVARKLFEELRSAYPSSSLAKNVGSFALQLGPN